MSRASRRLRRDAVCDDPGVDAFALEDRLDQLAEPGRDDQRIVLGDELAEPRADTHVLDEPGAHLLERRPIVAISAAITSSSVSVVPSSSSSASKTPRSPKRSIAMCSRPVP